MVRRVESQRAERRNRTAVEEGSHQGRLQVTRSGAWRKAAAFVVPLVEQGISDIIRSHSRCHQVDIIIVDVLTSELESLLPKIKL